MTPTIRSDKYALSESSNRDIICETERNSSNCAVTVIKTPSSRTTEVPMPASGRFFTPNSPQKMIPVPPEITSTLTKDRSSVIKPIAFKPLLKKMDINDGQRYGSTPVLTKSSNHIHHYGSSNDLRRQTNRTYDLAQRKLRSASPTAMSSLPYFNHRSTRSDYDDLDNVNIMKIPSSYSKESDIYVKSFRSLDRVNGIMDDNANSLMDFRSSSSDSASFAEIEVTLREKDNELSYLRRTMEHNEEVIFNVYKEKEQAYERELRKLRVLHESKMRTATQKSIKLEQMLNLRSYQFQEEQKRLKDENIKTVGEICVLREEINDLRTRLEETEWKLCQRTGEFTHLKSELNRSQDDRRNYCHEISCLKNKINQLKSILVSKDTETDLLKETLAKNADNDKSIHLEIFQLFGQLENEVTNEKANLNKSDSKNVDNEGRENIVNLIDKIKKKISNVIKKLHEERTSWDNEKSTWIAEKEKVLCYQKRLQLNYIEMFRRNKSLESELKSLSVELRLNSGPRRTELVENAPSSTIMPL